MEDWSTGTDKGPECPYDIDLADGRFPRPRNICSEDGTSLLPPSCEVPSSARQRRVHSAQTGTLPAGGTQRKRAVHEQTSHQQLQGGILG